jgi:hypothetical protein
MIVPIFGLYHNEKTITNANFKLKINQKNHTESEKYTYLVNRGNFYLKYSTLLWFLSFFYRN